MKNNIKDTKEKIVDAAYEILAREGYERASTKEIAKEAGVAQGLINYYFHKKDDLFIEVLRKEMKRYGAFLEEVNTIPSDQIFHVMTKGLEEKVRNYSQWYRLRYELFALGMRNPVFMHEVKQLLAEGRNNVASILSKVYPKVKHERRDDLVAIIIVCLDGLALQKIADPDFDIGRSYSILVDLINSYISD